MTASWNRRRSGPGTPRAGLLAACCLLAGCGYTAGFAGDRLGIRTVAVRTVENLSFRQDLGLRLSRRLARDLPHYTGLVPGSFAAADAVLEVVLEEASGRLLTGEGEGRIREGAIRLSARYRLVERGTGRVLGQGRASDWAEFRVPVGEDQESALREAVADLSRKILLAFQDI